MNVFSTKENEGLAKNLCYAIFAQGVGFSSSLIMSLIIPKVLGVESYAYWQMFVLYSSYVGFALFGINDGLYLRLGGKRYAELNKGALKAQFAVIGIFQMAVAALCFVLLFFSGVRGDRFFVFLFVVVFGLLHNNLSCLSYMFQSVNLTQIASISSLVNRVVFLPFLVVFIVLDSTAWIPVAVVYLLCQTLSLGYCLVCARDVLRSNISCVGEAVRDCAIDLKAGGKVMIAYYSDTLIVGLPRMLADWSLGLVTFGKLSFSFSLINFALNFIGQFAMVAFPVLKRFGSDDRREKYVEIRSLLHCALPVVYLGYVPMCVVLSWWLPDYRESLAYLALVLPLCLYSCKANILFTTYLKMNRNESTLCVVNVVAMAFNAMISTFSIVVCESVELASVGIIVSVFVRDCVFELIMSCRYDVSVARNCVAEGLLSAGFMAASWFLSEWSFVLVVAMLVTYWYADRGSVFNTAKIIGNRLSSKYFM